MFFLPSKFSLCPSVSFLTVLATVFLPDDNGRVRLEVSTFAISVALFSSTPILRYCLIDCLPCNTLIATKNAMPTIVTTFLNWGIELDAPPMF